MADKKFLDMRFYNSGKTVQDVQFSNSRTLPVLSNELDYDLCIARWDCDTNAVPCYIAKLYDPNFDDQFVLNNLTQLPTINPIGSSRCITNMQVMVEFNGEYCTGNVLWVPTNLKMVPPASLDRANCVKSEYFHAYSSLHICQLIANTLSQVCQQFEDLAEYFTESQIHLEKVDGMYTFLFPNGLLENDIVISFSNEVNDLFGFNTVPHENLLDCYVLVIKRSTLGADVFLGIPEQQYSVVRAGYKSSYMFPFSTIEFQAVMPHVDSLLVYNNNGNASNGLNSTICDMIFDVSDVDEFYNKATYFAPNYDRRVKILNTQYSAMNQILITVTFKTPDNFPYPLKLRTGRTAGVLLAFIPAE